MGAEERVEGEERRRKRGGQREEEEEGGLLSSQNFKNWRVRTGG